MVIESSPKSAGSSLIANAKAADKLETDSGIKKKSVNALQRTATPCATALKILDTPDPLN
jgi:hypothetical protein